MRALLSHDHDDLDGIEVFHTSAAPVETAQATAPIEPAPSVPDQTDVVRQREEDQRRRDEQATAEMLAMIGKPLPDWYR